MNPSLEALAKQAEQLRNAVQAFAQLVDGVRERDGLLDSSRGEIRAECRVASFALNLAFVTLQASHDLRKPFAPVPAHPADIAADPRA